MNQKPLMLSVLRIGPLGVLSLCLLSALTAWADVRSELRWSSDSFLSPAYDSSGPSTSQFFGAAFSNSKASDPLRVDMRGAYASGAPLLSYINIREFAYSTKMSGDQSFSVGRKLEDWSELDRRWNFGVIEPVFKWNPLSPESQGLSGLFWHSGGQNLRISLFGSFFYVPEQGASFEIDEQGRFVRGNPWFRRPPSSIQIFDQVSEIEYNLDRPREADIVFQPSYGARLELFDEKPWLLRVSGFYKPMNQLALGYDGVLDIPEDRGSVDIMPAVSYHQVMAADVQYRASFWRTGLSVIHDRPSKENPFESRWTRPVFPEATIVSPFVDVAVLPGWILSLQRLDVSAGETREEGPLASPTRASITSRYPYSEANQIGLEYVPRVFRSRKVGVKTSYMWSTKDAFQLIRLEGRLDFSKQWSLQSELNLVEARALESGTRNDIAEFRNNDRVVVGAGYAF